MVIINIDTSKDSREEIRKTIRYLQEIVEDSTSSSTLFDPKSDTSGESSSNEFSSMMGMFGDDSGSSGSGNPFVDNDLKDDGDAASLLDSSESDDDSDVDTNDGAEIVTTGDDAFIELVEYE